MISSLDGAAPIRLRACEVCGSSRATRIEKYTTSPWPVVSCSDCGFVFLQSVPGYEALDKDYAWEKTSAQEAKVRKARRFAWIGSSTRWRMQVGRWITRQFRRRAPVPTGVGLDIGCGEDCRLPAGQIPYGIEISSALTALSKPKFVRRGGDVHCAPAIEGLGKFNDNFFDTILMRSYLEHEENPRSVLEKAFAKLKPGGIIYVRIPDFGSINRRVMGTRWCGFRFPDHVNYFTDASLRKLSSSIGFTYVRKNWASVLDDNLDVELVKPAR
jgi:SAM-dependent methyltransferase